MGPSRADLVREGFAAVNAGDLDALDAVVADDMVAEVPTGFANASTYRGRAEFRRMAEDWLEPWVDFRAELLELTEVGDAIVASVRQSAIGRESGIPVDMDLAYLMRVRGDRLVEWRLCASTEEALALARP